MDISVNGTSVNGTSDTKTCQVLVVRGKDRGKICGKPACTPANTTHVAIDCCGQHYRTEILKPPEVYRQYEHRVTPNEISKDYLAFIIQ